MDEFEKRGRDEIYSKSVRAGKRTYFFDVKVTRGDEKYITITESKKRFDEELGKVFYEKHKIFLYQEDFEKFIDGLNHALDFIQTGEVQYEDSGNSLEVKGFTDIDFDDLDTDYNKDGNII
ncbi:MAG: DUF3276 family protein [Bacteroidota bacterium]